MCSCSHLDTELDSVSNICPGRRAEVKARVATRDSVHMKQHALFQKVFEVGPATKSAQRNCPPTKKCHVFFETNSRVTDASHGLHTCSTKCRLHTTTWPGLPMQGMMMMGPGMMMQQQQPQQQQQQQGQLVHEC
eukprot:1422062-Amphidinium_carterae.1